MVKKCTNCGAPVKDDQALFCNKCGSKIPEGPFNEFPLCNNCGTPAIDDQAVFCNRCGNPFSDAPQDEKITFNKIETLPKKRGIATKKIEETRCTCSACGNVWFFGKKEVYENYSKILRNAGKNISGVTCCCWPMSYMGREQTDMGKCPRCGSKAVKKEQIFHEVE